MSERYYAHSSESADRQTWHKLAEHLTETGNKAAELLAGSECEELARTAGLLHDAGKYTAAFQRRLRGDPSRVNHSTAGAKIAIERYGQWIGKALAYTIAGHHAGLANGVNGARTSSLKDRLEDKAIEVPDKAWQGEIEIAKKLNVPTLKMRNRETIGLRIALMIRMVFSALVDADYLDTEAYYAKLESAKPLRGGHPALDELATRLDTHLKVLEAIAKKSPVNALRHEVLAHARDRAKENPGIFTLTVPTGGGKTLTSLAFALEHARTHGLSRVIYVIPYTSIIEQTASVFREALRSGESGEAEFVIEHHSTFDEEDAQSREGRKKLQLAMENWDAPIIVTTAVQFFESLFAARPSRCRKVHSVMNSVIVLDEAQTLPLRVLRPCVTTLDELALNWGSTVVLCTATQPALTAPEFEGGFEDAREIAPPPQALYQRLKRAEIVHAGKMQDAELIEQLSEHRQGMCIVNTRRHARELYEAIGHLEGALHLTTLLCAKHRQAKLAKVRERLSANAPVHLIATSLVEAGVDIDFPTVWRAETGLESIIQAAGRCNREGRRTQGCTYVFEPEREAGGPEIQQLAAAARTVMREHSDPASLDAIRDYFREIYWIKGKEALDAKQIERRLNERAKAMEFAFEDVAEDFRIIDTAAVPIIVPYEGVDGQDHTVAVLTEKLRQVERPGMIARQLQPYVVSVWPKIRTRLIVTGAASIIEEQKWGQQFVLLENRNLYDKETGLHWADPVAMAPNTLIIG